MFLKYLEGDVTVKGVHLPNSAVRCLDIIGDETNHTWSYTFGIYGDIDTSLDGKHEWFDIVKLLVMMDGYQPNNVETKINVFEYGLNKLKELDTRFSNFTLKEVAHELVFTHPPSNGGDILLDPVLFNLNPIRGTE